MRRKDKEVTNFTEICAVIERCPILHLGLVDQGKAYIVPVNFSFTVTNDNIQFFFHGARDGKKFQLLQETPHITFEAEHLKGLITDEIPCKWTTAYESVMGEGTVTLLKSHQDQIQAMQSILCRHGYQGTETAYSTALPSIALFSLTVTAISCKQKAM